MNPRKVGLIIAVLIVLGVGFMLLNSVFNKDAVKPQLDTIIANNQAVVALTDEASSGLSTYALQTQNATLYATTTSDNTQLKNYYKKRYGKSAKEPKDSDKQATELKGAQPGSQYDSKYRGFLQELLQNNTATIKTIYDETKNQELKSLMQQLYTNQGTALKLLN